MAESAAPDRCFDYSTPEGEAEAFSAISEVLEIRAELADPAAARRVGRDERLYELTLGLVVVPVLVWRAVSGSISRGDGPSAPSTAGNLVREIRQELVHDTMSPKMRLYERSLGLAVVPMLVRQLVRTVAVRPRRR